jgi:hypothetical protein
MRQQSLAGMALQKGQWWPTWQRSRDLCGRGSAQVAGWPTPVRCLGSGVLPRALAGERRPIRTCVRRPIGPPLLYFPAVLAVRTVRISLLTSGAKRARTADLLHAIWRQHVHPRPSPQVTVLTRPCAAAAVRVRCGTSVLYRCHPRREHQPRPPDAALTSVNPLRQATGVSFGVHPVNQARETGPSSLPRSLFPPCPGAVA